MYRYLLKYYIIIKLTKKQINNNTVFGYFLTRDILYRRYFLLEIFFDILTGNIFRYFDWRYFCKDILTWNLSNDIHRNIIVIVV